MPLEDELLFDRAVKWSDVVFEVFEHFLFVLLDDFEHCGVLEELALDLALTLDKIHHNVVDDTGLHEFESIVLLEVAENRLLVNVLLHGLEPDDAGDKLWVRQVFKH